MLHGEAICSLDQLPFPALPELCDVGPQKATAEMVDGGGNELPMLLAEPGRKPVGAGSTSPKW